MYKNIKIISLNFIILLFLFIILEITARAYYVIKDYPLINFGYMKLTGYDLEGYIGISDFHPQLGYVPGKNINKYVPGPGWHAAKYPLKTNELTYRLNENNLDEDDYVDGKKYLFVGASMTFGDQVDNTDSFPACFERETRYRTDNAAVYGYGAYQSVLRAKLASEISEYSNVSWTIVLGDGFSRDRLYIRSGLPSIAIIKKANSNVEPVAPNKDNHYGGMVDRGQLLNTLRKVSFLINRYFQNKDARSGPFANSVHPDHAKKEEIINFDFKEFSKINIPNKNILIIYATSNFEDNELENTQRERDLILSYAKKYNIKVIDSYNLTSENRHNGIYYGHFTPKGNRLICKLLTERLYEK